MIYPCGAKRDPNGRGRGAPVHRLIGTSSDVPDAFDLTGAWSRIPSQNGGSCEGHAFAQALRTVSRGRLDPAAMAIYALGRQLEQPTMSPLTDGGAFTYRIVEGLESWGVVDRARWPDDSDPAKRVTADVLEAGAERIVTGVYAFNVTLGMVPPAIRRAVSQWHPVVFAMDVGDSYFHYSGGLWTPVGGADEHCQCIVGYRPDAAKVANSWGAAWGEGGYSWIPWSWLASANAYDFTIVTVAP